MSNETRPARRGRAGQTRQASPQSRGSSGRGGLDATTVSFIVLVLAVIAGSAFIVFNNNRVADTGAIQEVSPSVEIEGEALPTLEDGMTPLNDPALGTPAPVVTGEDFFGDEVTLPLEGQATILTFLSHSCQFCQAELPVLLEEWIDGDLPDGVAVAAVATNTNEEFANYPPSDWLFARSNPWTAPLLADTASSEMAQAYGLPAYPFFAVVGADGNVLARTTGQQGADGLQALVDLAAGSADVSQVDVGEGGTQASEEGEAPTEG